MIERRLAAARPEDTGVRPVSQLLHDAVAHSQGVVRTEVRLAVAKAQDELTQVVRKSVLRAVAGVFAAIGLVLVMITAVKLLELRLPTWQAVGIVALVNIVLAAVLALFPVGNASDSTPKSD